MKKPTIDVIIPTYNGLPWLQAAIESVLMQTHEQLKLYVIDDGSTDETKKYVKSIKDDRVVYIHKPNGGQSSARNLGIRSSHSPFVAFLDSDDLWTADKLEKQLAVMNSDSEVGLVYGHHYTIDEDDIVLRNLRIWKRGYIADDLSGGNLIAGSASMVLIRRTILTRAGFFHEDFVNGEDWELWLRIALISKIDFVPEILASIRQHPNSHQVNTKKMADGLIYAYGVMKQELDLSDMQRKRVASYCLFNAADMYLRLGNRWEAKRVLLYLFRENTRAFFQAENWKIHIAHGLFSRVIFGNPVFDFFMRCLRKAIKVYKKAFRFSMRVLRYLGRRVRRIVT